jgi:hypothetical protein
MVWFRSLASKHQNTGTARICKNREKWVTWVILFPCLGNEGDEQTSYAHDFPVITPFIGQATANFGPERVGTPFAIRPSEIVEECP